MKYKGDIMCFRLIMVVTAIVLTTLSSPNVIANNFLLGVNDVKAEKYEQAIQYFSQKKSIINSQNWRDQSKLRIWLGFSHLAAKHDYKIAEPFFVEALCASVPKKHDINLGCTEENRFSTEITSEQELDRLVATLSVVATKEWGAENYEQSLARSTLVNRMLIENINLVDGERSNFSKMSSQAASNKEAHGQGNTNKVDYSQFHTMNELMIELSKQEQLATENMTKKALTSILQQGGEIDRESLINQGGMKSIAIKKSIVQAYIQMMCMPGMSVDSLLQHGDVTKEMGDDSEEFILHLKRIANLEADKNNCSSNPIANKERAKSARTEAREVEKVQNKLGRKLGKLESRQGNYFQRLSRKLVCADKIAPDTSSVESMMRSQYDPLGSFVEANRGNRLSNLKLSQSSVLDQLQAYFASLKHYRDVTSSSRGYISRDYANFRKRVSKCGSRPDLSTDLMMSMVETMKRGTHDETYYRKIIETIIKISDNPSSSTINYAIELIYAHGLLAKRLALSGEIDQAIKHYRESINVMVVARAHPMLMGMLESTEVMTEFAKVLKQSGRPVGEIYDAINMLVEKHKVILSKSQGIASLNEQQHNQEQIQSHVDSANSMLEGMEAMISQMTSSMNLPEDQLEKFRQGFNEVQAQLNSEKTQTQLANVMSQSPSSQKADNKENDEFSKYLSEMKQRMDEGPFSADFAGTVIENQRNLINENRLFNLGIARIMLALDDLNGAEEWILSANNEVAKNLTPAYFSARTLSLEAYVRAQYYQKLGHVNHAKSNYALAIKHWYFNPHSPMELLFNIYETPTVLLEEAADYELTHGGEETAFYYLELARHAFVDSNRLYGRLNSDGLKLYQEKLEEQYQRLLKNAEEKAKAQGYAEEFVLAKRNSNARRDKSTRDQITPLMPLYTALVPYVSWLNRIEMQEFLGGLEKFNASWEFNKLSDLRQDMLTEKYNTAIVQELLAVTNSSGQGGIFGDEVLFRSARTGKDIASPSYSISGNSGGGYVPLKDYAKVKESLSDDETLLTYWFSPEYTYAFASTKEQLYSKRIANSELLVPVKILTGSNNNAHDIEAAQQLYESLIAPFKDELRRNVIFVVNGPLQNLAFSSLIDPADNIFFGEKYPTRYYPSVDAVFQELVLHTPKNNHLLVLAPGNVEGQDKLQHHELEAASISRHFKTKVYLDNDVTKSLVTQELPQYKMVHFAGHARLDESLPDFSRLILAQDQSGESSIFVHEIRKMDLRNLELVVLSACETGSTTDFNLNNEFTALNAAFLAAGVDSVVATLRLVDDAIAYKIMAQFYIELSKGFRKDEALQRAQQYMRNDGAAPEDWSSFVLSGSNEPISFLQN